METRLDTVASGPIAAVVSHLPQPMTRARRGDLLAHSDVLQALIADRDVVPVRFGTVFATAVEVGTELLEKSGPAIERLLDEVHDMVELQVKAAYREDVIAAALLSSDRTLRQMKAASRSGRDSYQSRLEMGQRFAALLERRRAADADAMGVVLGKAAREVRIDALGGDYAVAKASCLVRRHALAEFDSTVDALRKAAGPLMNVSTLGPLPPYSFVETDLAGVA
jgi:hypothetical protein